ILPDGRAPMRAGTKIFATETAETPMGEITSGAFGPTIQRPMSMGYVATEFAKTGTTIYAELRGKRLPATVADMPFRPSTYKR
ncbi:MAG TPA: glycine cleavage system aminomethyltransferase GcvT, partial [Rhodobacteraceae bacterium]|nr:glycine cleavage system aminomethyltransferase GcvT [Paracoccaceae bacterium]